MRLPVPHVSTGRSTALDPSAAYRQLWTVKDWPYQGICYYHTMACSGKLQTRNTYAVPVSDTSVCQGAVSAPPDLGMLHT